MFEIFYNIEKIKVNKKKYKKKARENSGLCLNSFGVFELYNTSKKAGDKSNECTNFPH